MKIIFINPPVCNFVGYPIANSPTLGIIYLATILDKVGHSVKVIDADSLELSWDKLKARLAQEKPDIIGLTATTLGMPILYKTAEVCREALGEAKILAGGFGPTLEPEKTLDECPAIDVLGLGECESNIVDLIECLENKKDLKTVKGIAFRGQNGEFCKTEPQSLIDDLDSIPFPNYQIVEPDFSAYHGVHGGWEGIDMPNAVMMGSRGCPHRCIFCCNAGKKPRFRSPKSIVDEIEFYKKELKVKSVQLYDNEFIGMSSQQNQWVREICEEIIKRGVDDLGYICQGRCNSFIDLETLKMMHKAGFRWIWWGVESGSQKVLDRIKKDLKLENVYHSFKLAKEAGIHSMMFVMVGFPGETKEDINKTGKLIKEIKPDRVRIHITTPLPGSELWDELYSKGQIDEFDYFKYDTRLTVVHHTDTMTREEIKNYYRLLVFRFENGYWYFAKFFIQSLFTIDGWKKLSRRLKIIFSHFFGWFRLLLNK
ncbi:MAG: radical SAM protein [Patescibacteria group bacterium]|jgi:anaerobic magnesium-protoporphyrin IX monomethyl ester cyclase